MLKTIFYVLIFCIFFVYSVKSISYLSSYSKQINDLLLTYSKINEQKINMEKEMLALKIKINGLKENSINYDILQTQIKINLNYSKKQEIIILE
jgi:sensor histidine kinase YesM